MEEVDFLIVGAGIVGLTLARELVRRESKAKIRILEKESRVGCHASGRNSGVLHSGIYYAPETLKARLCAEGARKMLAYAREKKVAHRVGGKVILATGPEDEPGLARLEENAKANKIRAHRLSAAQLKEREPHAAPGEALHCLDTAVVDAKGVLQALEDELINEGVRLSFNEEMTGVEGATVETRSGKCFRFGKFFNCAGAYADKIARMFGLARDVRLVPFKGIYWKLRSGADHWVSESIYPVPDLSFPFLGIHLTRNVNGEVFVGPTAIPALGRENYEWFKGIHVTEGLDVLKRLVKMYAGSDDVFRRLVNREVGHYVKARFWAAARRLVPSLPAQALERAAKVGIRPQLVHASGKLEMDFRVETTPHSLHVLNAISPAFTCSMAFAQKMIEDVMV